MFCMPVEVWLHVITSGANINYRQAQSIKNGPPVGQGQTCRLALWAWA